MITVGAVVGRGFLGKNNELWLFIGVDLRAGKFLGVDDSSGKQSCDCLLLENQMDSSYVFFSSQLDLQQPEVVRHGGRHQGRARAHHLRRQIPSQPLCPL